MGTVNSVENTDTAKAVTTKETKWSYSRLSTYAGCHFRYKLQYVDKNYPKGGSVATDFGTAIHHAEESIANYIKDGQTIDYIAIKNQFIIDCTKVADRYHADWWSVNKDSGKTYEEQKMYYLDYGIFRLEKYMANNPSYTIVGAEVKIDYVYKDTKRFTGSIDRLIYDNARNKYIIQDVKSWPVIEKHKDELKTPTQLVVYSLALAEMKQVDLADIECAYDLPLVDNIFSAGKDDYIRNAIEELDTDFYGINSEDWTPAPKPLCAWCPFSRTNPDALPGYRDLCPYHSIWDREVRNPKTSVIPAHQWRGLANHTLIMENYLKGSE